jgi:hypothetical protein
MIEITSLVEADDPAMAGLRTLSFQSFRPLKLKPVQVVGLPLHPVPGRAFHLFSVLDDGDVGVSKSPVQVI